MILDKLKQPASDDSDYVIDLAAMLGLMVTLIPMLLLSTAFVTINAVEVEVPLSVSAETTTGDDDKSDEKYTTLEVHVAKEITLVVKQGEPIRNEVVETTTFLNSFDLKEFLSAYSEIALVKVNPSDQATMQDIVKVIDAIKNANSEKISSISFGNVIEG